MPAEHDAELEALAQTIYDRVHGHEWKPTFMTDVTECFEAANAILDKFLPDHDKRVRAEQRERAWREGYYTGKRDYAGSITGGMPISTPNPYARRES